MPNNPNGKLGQADIETQQSTEALAQGDFYCFDYATEYYTILNPKRVRMSPLILMEEINECHQ